MTSEQFSYIFFLAYSSQSYISLLRMALKPHPQQLDSLSSKFPKASFSLTLIHFSKFLVWFLGTFLSLSLLFHLQINYIWENKSDILSNIYNRRKEPNLCLFQHVCVILRNLDTVNSSEYWRYQYDNWVKTANLGSSEFTDDLWKGSGKGTMKEWQKTLQSSSLEQRKWLNIEGKFNLKYLQTTNTKHSPNTSMNFYFKRKSS